MERTITIGDKEVKLKANAMLPLIYQVNFGEDIFKVQGKLFSFIGKDGKVDFKGAQDLDCVGLMKITWCMAKAADGSIPELEKWLDEFDSFPMLEIFAEIHDMYLNNMVTVSRIKNAKAAEN